MELSNILAIVFVILCVIVIFLVLKASVFYLFNEYRWLILILWMFVIQPLGVMVSVAIGMSMGAGGTAIATKGMYGVILFLPVIALTKFMLVSVFQIRFNFKLPKITKKVRGIFWLEAIGGYKINIPNPFRGIFISGGAGAGKSKSVILPFLDVAINNGFAGLLYDYENPVLANHAKAGFQRHQTNVRDYYINFTDLTRSHRLNPLDPNLMTSSSYAREYSSTILSNLMPETIAKEKTFWTRSTEALLTAIIWYLRQEKPEWCTLPHAVSLLLSEDPERLVEVISSNLECAGMVASIKSGLKSENQTAGVVGTAQNVIACIDTPEIFWVLSGNDLTLDLNNPDDPKFLTVGNVPTLVDTYTPVISLIISAALKSMNQQGKKQSLVMIDELPTIYIPNLDRLPATARKNQIATVLCVQDFSQLEDKYGIKKTEVITSVLANQFFGQTTNPKTAARISQLYGKYDHPFLTHSSSQSRGKSNAGGLFGTSSSNKSHTTSQSIQERYRVRPEQLLLLNQGEFFSTIPGGKQMDYSTQLKEWQQPAMEILPTKAVPNFLVKQNYLRIKDEVTSLLQSEISQYS